MHSQIWAGENGPIGGGDDGTCGPNATCGTYATTLWYSDDMGLRSLHGFKSYQRQDLFGGAYGLTNSVSGEMALGPADPLILRPDYWVNFLWKRLLGPQVYNVSSSSSSLRAYAFAGTPPSPFGESACASASVQLVLLYLNETAGAAVSLPAAPARKGHVGQPESAPGFYSAWTLTSTDGDPFSTLSSLNGAALPTTVDAAHVNPATFLSKITQPAHTGRIADGLPVPPLSTTFVCY